MAMSQREELELLMLEKERRRRLSAKQADENWSDLKTRTVEGAKELAVDIPVGAAQGATFGHGDEIYGGLKALATDQPYESARQDARDVISRARDRSPVGSFAGEMIGGGAVGGGGSLLKSVGQGALYGVGESENLADAPINALVGGSISGLTHGVISAAKIPFSETGKTRSKFLGATKKDFKKDGMIGDPMETQQRLNNMGLFKSGGVEFDSTDLKFKGRDGFFLAPSREEALANSKTAIKRISKEKERILGEANKKIDQGGLKEMVTERLGKLRPNSADKELFDATTTKEFAKVMDDIYFDGGMSRYNEARAKIRELSKNRVPVRVIEGQIDEITNKARATGKLTATQERKLLKLEAELEKEIEIKEIIIPKLTKEADEIIKQAEGKDVLKSIEKAKQNWQDKSKESYKSSVSDPVFKEQAQIQKEIAATLKEFVEDSVANNVGIKKSSRFMDLNDASHTLRNGVSMLEDAVAGDRSSGSGISGVVNPYASKTLNAAKGAEYIGGGDKGQIIRSKIGDKMSSLPMIDEIEQQVIQAPNRVLIRDRNERKPQSIPEQLIRAKIPRNSQEVMNDPEFIKAKVAQQAPMLFDQVQEVLDNNPESIKDVMLVLSQQAPHLFENDKYGRIDGKIVDPNKKQMAREDVMLNDEMSNSQKMIIINQLNKTGDFPL